MYTIGSFLREEELTGLKLMTDTADLQAEITNINIIDNPDSYDWLSSGDFLLTTGYFLRDDEAMQCQLVRELSELGCVGLAIKTRRYLDVIPEAMLEEANRLGFPLINIPVQYPLSKICKVVFGRLSGGGVEKADRFVSLYHSITESMLEADGVSRMLGVLSDFIGNAVLLLGAKWELMAYAENAGNPMPLSRYLPLQKGEVIFPESITGNMPSDFSKYAKAIKRVFSAGEERAVCRILPVSGGNALFGYLVVWETGRKMQSVEYLALEIAASSLALERFRTRQIEEIRMHIRQDFFDDLLSGKLHSAEEVGSIAGMHNMDAEGTYLCMVTKLDSAARGTERSPRSVNFPARRAAAASLFIVAALLSPFCALSIPNRTSALVRKIGGLSSGFTTVCMPSHSSMSSISVWGSRPPVLSMCAAALPRRRRLSGSPAICAAWQGCIFTRTSSSISCLAAEWKMKNPPSFIRCLSAVW